MLKKEYTALVLNLAGTANAKLLKAVRGMIKQAEVHPLTQYWENRIGRFFPASHSYPLIPY